MQPGPLRSAAGSFIESTAMEGFTTSDSDSELHALKTLDLSRAMLGSEAVESRLLAHLQDDQHSAENIENLILSDNRLHTVPECVGMFTNLRVLDVSGNNLKYLPDFLATCPLTSLIARNNGLHNDSLPKTFASSIKELNLSGNNLTDFPPQVLGMSNLKYLYLGGNKIDTIPTDVHRISG